MSDEPLARLRAGIASVARKGIKRYGLKLAVVNMTADAVARTVVLEKATGKIVTLEVQISNLQDRVAALEAKLAAQTTPAAPSMKTSDPIAGPFRLRQVSNA